MLKIGSEWSGYEEETEKGNSCEGRFGTKVKISTNCELCAILLKLLRLRELENVPWSININGKLLVEY